MCGIAYVKKLDGTPANRKIKQIYFNQKDRGVNGYGFVNIETGSYKREKYEHKIFHDLKMSKNSEILFHHRRPTSTPNTVQTAHPLLGNNPMFKYNYYFVHNGKIHNADDLFKIHKETYGIDYSTYHEYETKKGKFFYYNDSESLMIELILCIEGIKAKDSFAALGGMAFIMLQVEKESFKPNALFYGRNLNSPLYVNTNDKEIIIASKGEGMGIDTHCLFRYDYATNATTKEKFDLGLTKMTSFGRQLIKDMSDVKDEVIEIEQKRFDFTSKDVLGLDESIFYTDMEDEQIERLLEDSERDKNIVEASLQNEHDIEERNRLRDEIKGIDADIIKLKREIYNRKIKNSSNDVRTIGVA